MTEILGRRMGRVRHKTSFGVEFHVWTSKRVSIHQHEYFEFAVCNKGDFVHYKNEDPPELIKEKQVIFLTPEDYHYIEAKKKNSTHLNISVAPQLFFELCRYFEVQMNNGIFGNKTITLTEEEFQSVNRQVNYIMQLNGEADEVFFKSALKRLAMDLFYCYTKREKQKKDIPQWLTLFVEKVCTVEFFECRASELYKYTNYSQPIITGAFKRYYGCTFVQYFTREKIRYACGLLANTNMGILDISNRLGFSSLSHFNNIFKKIVGMTPSKYRHQ